MGVIGGSHKSDRDIQLGNIAKTVAGWITTGDTTSTTLLGLDRSGGGISLYSTTDNECAVYEWGGGEMFDFGDVGFRTKLEWKQKYTSAASAGNMFVGFTDLSDNTLIANGDTIGSGDHIGIACLSADAPLRAFLPVVQNAAANSGTALAALSMVTATEYVMRIELEGLQAGITARFYIDNVLVQTVSGVSYTSFGPEMALVICVSPAATAANTLAIYEMTVSHRAMS
jgi:hypothetical protein